MHMLAIGLKAAGYEFVNLDDCWQIDRDANGRIIEDREKFPSGMKNLSDYIRSIGLKFGTYTDAGFMTCSRRPGSLGYETIDAQTYAEWNVDYLKVDNCYPDASPSRERFTKIRDALNATGRPIVYSICNGQVTAGETTWEWAIDVGNSWRTTFDIRDDWNYVIRILDLQIPLTQYAQPGAWNDPDMMEMGNGNMTLEEYRSHFTLWAALKSPLLIGSDIFAISDEIIDILTNPEIIAINQDKLGKSVSLTEIGRGHQHYDIWTGPLVHGATVVVLLNRENKSEKIEVDWYRLGFKENANLLVRDLWKRKNLGVMTSSHTFHVEPHGVVVLKVRDSHRHSNGNQLLEMPKNNQRRPPFAWWHKRNQQPEPAEEGTPLLNGLGLDPAAVEVLNQNLEVTRKKVLRFSTDFVTFVTKGNGVDVAIGLMVGASASLLLLSLIEDLITPPFGFVTGAHLPDYFFVVRAGASGNGTYPTLAKAQLDGAITMNIGLFIARLLNFITVGFWCKDYANGLQRKRKSAALAVYPKFPNRAIDVDTAKYAETPDFIALGIFDIGRRRRDDDGDTIYDER
ncbi:alpha-galactosidase [Synchytrium microbalum]|uniref:Alpha-galactosidase n=1 Tax=Synchytrium microbalum TaxID=1806994 RepID=A0A507C830_9FUNG|nr:alpha-galactosidase [Synchytrium microbalum]TPX35478.1 alpha-galactosidase [Synchytrium microbalum]